MKNSGWLIRYFLFGAITIGVFFLILNLKVETYGYLRHGEHIHRRKYQQLIIQGLKPSKE